MNYAAQAYSPSYAQQFAQQPYVDPQQAAAMAQMQGYVDPQLAAYYSQQPAYAQVWPQDYAGFASTGQTPGAPAVTPPPAAPGPSPLSGAYWQIPMYGIPRWGWAAGAAALTGTWLAWRAGVFGSDKAPSSSRTTTVRRSSTGRSRSRALPARDPARASSMPWASMSSGSGGKKKKGASSASAWPAMDARDPARSKRRGKKRAKKSRRRAKR